MAKETEKIIEAYLRERVKELGGKAFKFVSPGNAGVPDRLVVLPEGRSFFVELKSPAGTLTALQEKQIRYLRKMGHGALVVYSKADVDRLVDAVKEWIS